MRTTRKLFALLLAAALSIAMLGTPAKGNADTQTAANTITVTLKVEDVDSTLISEQVTLTKEDVGKINSTFVVESGSIEIPVLTSEDFTAVHALGKHIMDTSDAPAADLTFSYGSPAYIKGQKSCDYYPYWSYRVNHASPSDETTGYAYTADTCPIKDGDCIVFFRQACYDPNAGDWGAYTKYSWFDQNSYETTVNTPVTVTYSVDDGFAGSTGPAANEEISVFENSDFIQKAVTDANGTAKLSFEKAGTYTITSSKERDGIPENSHASATITVNGSTVTPTTQPSAVPTAAPASVPTASPTVTPASNVPKPLVKPAVPKKLTVSVKKKSSASSKKVTLSWKKASGADGYQISVSKKNRKNFKKFATTSKTKITKKFKKGTFYIKVRSYAKQNGETVYSKYSNIIQVKIR